MELSEPWGSFEGECQGCSVYGPVNDMGLCETCAAKLERDLIRQQDWAYSWHAYGRSNRERKELRRQVIAQYGASLELIAPRGAPRQASDKRPKRRGAGK